MLHTHYITPSLLPLPQNRSRRNTNLVFLNPVTPSQITISQISTSAKVRFLILSSILNYSIVHQPATTNSIHLQSTKTLNWQYLQSELFAEIVNVFKPLAIFTGELHRGCLTVFQMRLCPINHYSYKTIWVELFHQLHKLNFPLSPNSFDLHQIQKQ